MSSATLLLPGLPWLWLAAGGLLLALALSLWGYLKAPPGPTRWICLGLKTLGVAALAVCLLEPLWSGQRARPGANLFAVVADNSQSLQIKDRAATRSRGEVLRERLTSPRAAWQSTLEEHFEVRRFAFDSRLQSLADFGSLAFDGRVSALGGALRAAAERFRGRPLAGMLLFTDGNATDLPAGPECGGLPPVYPVVVGSPDTVRDLALQQVGTTQTDFEDAPVSLQADVRAHGYAGESITAQVLDEAGKTVAEQTLSARQDDETLAFRFQLRPKASHLSFYRVQARARREAHRANAAAPSEEATLANNGRVVAVDRGHGPYRILYLSGRPNWEFKFLNRALQEDDQLQLVGLIRVARREPKFNFIGRTGETSNPLYRGFGNQNSEEVERYDQPVLIRLNTRDELELRGGFPRTAEELYAYHAVIVDDLEAEFFTPDQASLLQKFVSERGGGFLMLGGMETFQEGKYHRTPVGDMLPVYLDKVEDLKPAGGWRLDLTREGLLQSWARLRETEADEKQRLQTMAPFRVLNPVREVKPGASIIAQATDTAGRAYPALVVQRFGRGRTGALTLGDLWHWGLHDAASHQDMDKAWRQLMRWLVTDVPNRVEVTGERQPDDPNGAVRLQVRARDPRFQPLDNAAVHLEIQPVMVENAGAPGATNALHLPVEPSPKEPGVYQATYVPRLTGGYRATVCVTNAEGAEVGRAATGWSTDLAAEEFRSVTPNVALLETIAHQTGGAVLRLEDLDRFVDRLPARPAPVMETWTYPLWHTPAMYGFALACLMAEWGLRRWKGMP